MLLLPAPEYVCTGHSLHVAADVLPASVEYLPCRHKEQLIDPCTSLYVPALQAWHSPPSGPEYPRLHTQSLRVLLPSLEWVLGGQPMHVESEIAADASLYLPLGHNEQGSVPVLSLNVPATQALHGSPSRPVNPATHVQLVMTLLPFFEYEYAGQPLQAPSDVSPTPVENLPCGHSEHADEPL